MSLSPAYNHTAASAEPPASPTNHTDAPTTPAPEALPPVVDDDDDDGAAAPVAVDEEPDPPLCDTANPVDAAVDAPVPVGPSAAAAGAVPLDCAAPALPLFAVEEPSCEGPPVAAGPLVPEEGEAAAVSEGEDPDEGEVGPPTVWGVVSAPAVDIVGVVGAAVVVDCGDGVSDAAEVAVVGGRLVAKLEVGWTLTQSRS